MSRKGRKSLATLFEEGKSVYLRKKIACWYFG